MKQSPEPAAFSVNEFVAWAGITRTRCYDEINAGKLKARKLGSRTMILRSDGEAWLEALPVMETAQ